jgi:hypothetical protein
MPEEIKDQIDAMLKIGEPTVTDAPFTESVATEAPGTNAPATESPETVAPVTESPGTKAPATSAPTTEAPAEDELGRTKKENEALRKQLNEALKKEPTTKSPGTKAPSTEAPFEEVDFLGKEVDLDELTRDPDVLNKLLNKVHKMGSETSRKFQETASRNFPDVIRSVIDIQDTLKKKVDKFYTDNKDLQPFNRVVSTVYGELASENPDWDVSKVFSETEKETRKRLELQKKTGATSAPTTSAPKGPRFPKTKTSRGRQKPETSPLLEDIDKMNELY